MNSQTLTQADERKPASGRVEAAYGNLLHVKFTGDIRQGEVAYVTVNGSELKAEVIEIAGDAAKVQVYEDTQGIRLGTKVRFTKDLLEAELGPGLLTSIFDGLQNRLETVAEKSGYFLPRGLYVPSLDRSVKWPYTPLAKVGDELVRGDPIGETKEGRFPHLIMLPFSIRSKVTLTWTISAWKL